MKKIVNVLKGSLVLAGLWLFLAGYNVQAQMNKDSVTTKSDSTVSEDAPVEEAASDLWSPSIEFSSIQRGKDEVVLTAVLRSKIKGVLYKLPHLKISFAQVVDGEDRPLGAAITDRNGRAQVVIPVAKLSAPSGEGLSFKAIYAGNKQMEPAEESVQVHRARLDIQALKEEGVAQVQVKLVDLTGDAEQPVGEATIGLYVQRSFLPLKIGEGTTDASGEALIEVPSGLPGDEKGQLALIAKVEENETLGGVEAGTQQAWGIPAAEARKKQPRTLWTATPPLWMLVTFIILLTVVWGHYLVIIVQLIRLRKEEPGYQEQ